MPPRVARPITRAPRQPIGEALAALYRELGWAHWAGHAEEAMLKAYPRETPLL